MTVFSTVTGVNAESIWSAKFYVCMTPRYLGTFNYFNESMPKYTQESMSLKMKKIISKQMQWCMSHSKWRYKV